VFDRLVARRPSTASSSVDRTDRPQPDSEDPAITPSANREWTLVAENRSLLQAGLRTSGPANVTRTPHRPHAMCIRAPSTRPHEPPVAPPCVERRADHGPRSSSGQPTMLPDLTSADGYARGPGPTAGNREHALTSVPRRSPTANGHVLDHHKFVPASEVHPDQEGQPDDHTHLWPWKTGRSSSGIALSVPGRGRGPGGRPGTFAFANSANSSDALTGGGSPNPSQQCASLGRLQHPRVAESNKQPWHVPM